VHILEFKSYYLQQQQKSVHLHSHKENKVSSSDRVKKGNNKEEKKQTVLFFNTENILAE
jgi:hypothetical protein